MSWNPNKPPLETVTVSNTARKMELGKIEPKFKGFPQAPFPVQPQPVPASNNAPNTVQEAKELHEKIAVVNRAHQQRRDDDNVVDMSVGLLDIDTAILGYMQNSLNLQVIDNGLAIPVPVIYGSPERWQSALKDGYLRDKKGQLQNPIVMLRRTGFSRNDALMTLNRHMTETYVRKYSSKNRYDRFSQLNGFMIPTHEVYAVTCPDQIIVNYECVIWTDYTAQMNAIIERINWAVEEYWGDKTRLNFRVRIADFSNTVEVQADDDRIVRSDFVLEVWAYLLPETFEDYKATTQKSLTPRKVVFGVETNLTDYEMMNISTGKQPVQKFAQQGIDDSALKSALFDYQAVQKTVYGVFTSATDTLTTLTFANTSLLPTPTLLAGVVLDINKFVVFVDGNSISKLSIVSFMQTDTSFVVVLNNPGFEVTGLSEVFAIGKFA